MNTAPATETVSSNNLAARLVDAAAEAVFNEPTRYDEVGQQYRYDAKAAVVAVLRELADTFDSEADSLERKWGNCRDLKEGQSMYIDCLTDKASDVRAHANEIAQG